jgi:hypothetical protein
LAQIDSREAYATGEAWQRFAMDLLASKTSFRAHRGRETIGLVEWLVTRALLEISSSERDPGLIYHQHTQSNGSRLRGSDHDEFFHATASGTLRLYVMAVMFFW